MGKIKLLKNTYEEHLKQMEDRYYNFFQERLSEKYKKEGNHREREIYHMDKVISASNIDDFSSLKIKNLYLIESRGKGNWNRFSHIDDRIINIGPLYIPTFIHLDKSNWIYNDNFEDKSEKSPCVIAIIDEEKRFNDSILRQAIYSEIEHSINGLASPYGSYFESPVKITLKKEDHEMNYIAFKKNIACEEEEWWKSYKDELLDINESGIDKLINKSWKYVEVTNSHVFRNEEERIKELPFKISKLFVNNDSKTVETILENFRLGNNLTINVAK